MVTFHWLSSQKHIPKFSFLFLATLLLWLLVDGFWSLYTLNHGLLKTEKIDLSAFSSRHRSPAIALKTSFFGDYVPKNINDSSVRRSSLNLTVVGILLDDDNKSSHVIIRSANGREQTFWVGDELPGGALIKRITETGVLILSNGELESLALPKNELTFEPPPKPLVEE